MCIRDSERVVGHGERSDGLVDRRHHSKQPIRALAIGDLLERRPTQLHDLDSQRASLPDEILLVTDVLHLSLIHI